MEPISTTLTTLALKQAVTHFTKKLLDRNWSNDLIQGKTILEQLNEDSVAERYVDRYVTKNLKMRTLHSAESDVYLDEVYTPLTLRTASNGDELVVDDGFTLEYSKIINIIGIAGQGKSTILRKIFLEEIKCQKKFPFFIELRRIGEEGIIEHLKQNLIDIGLKIDDGSLEILLQSNSIILLLDGFDEVSSSLRAKVLTEITRIRTRFNCSLIVTTRPDTEICHESNISNLRVKRLEIEDIVSIISKLDPKNENPEVIELVRSNPVLQSTLVSPILVNLLFVCYPYLDVVPESVVDFYQKLFLTLYSRHDKIKNFHREKYSNTSPKVANSIFDALCFNSLNKGLLEFNEDSILEQLELALKYNSVESNQLDNVKQDIINITCLIQRDGFDRYVFLHKSVQEFHAARFISSLPHDHKIRFYQKLSSIIEDEDRFDNVICFLKEIDKNDYESLLLLEYFNSHSFSHFESNKESVIEKCLSSSFARKEVSYIVEKNSGEISNSGFSSLTFGNILSSIAILTHGSRFNSNKVEDELFSIMDRISSQIYSTEGIVDTYIKPNAIRVSNSDDDKINYTLNMKDCFSHFGEYELIKERISECLNDFYNSHYLPISKKTSELSAILDLDFDM